jgi:NADH-ubiquinone oxidoreductase chain 5
MPTPVSALLHAATMVAAGIFLLLRISPLLEYSDTLLVLVIWIGSLTALFAATSALFQNDLKRVIAYSTCSQLGMLLVSCGLSQYDLALFHLVNHAFFKALLFLAAGVVIHALNDEQDMRAYGALVQLLPFTYTMLLIGSLSLMAIPFLTGFYSKELIIASAYGNYSVSGHVGYWLSVLAALFTALYSTRMLYLTFYNRPNGGKDRYLSVHESPVIMAIPLVILAILSIFFGYFGQDAFVGAGSNFYGNALFQHPNHVLLVDTHFSVPLLYNLLPVVLPSIGSVLLLALYTFYPRSLISLISSKLGRSAYACLNQAYRFNLLYALITNKVLALAFYCSKTLDRGVLELLGPYGLVSLLLKASQNMATLDTGFVPHYALYFVLALISFVILTFQVNEPEYLLILIVSILLYPYSSSSDKLKNSPPCDIVAMGFKMKPAY